MQKFVIVSQNTANKRLQPPKYWSLWPQLFNWKLYLSCWLPCLPPSEKHQGMLQLPTLWFCEGSKQQNIYSHQRQCWLRTAGRPVENHLIHFLRMQIKDRMEGLMWTCGLMAFTRANPWSPWDLRVSCLSFYDSEGCACGLFDFLSIPHWCGL